MSVSRFPHLYPHLPIVLHWEIGRADPERGDNRESAASARRMIVAMMSARFALG
jgi:hypothetical protein